MRRRITTLALLFLAAGACANVLGVTDYDKAPASTKTDAQTTPPDAQNTLPDALADAPLQDAADANPVVLGVRCGKVVCPTPGACCADFGSWTIATCVKDSIDCSGDALECDDGSDCPAGEVCCGSSVSLVRQSTCRTNCRGSDELLCDPADPSSCKKLPGTICQPVVFPNGLTWLSACR